MSSLASLSPLPRGHIGPRRLDYTPAQSDCPPETESSPGTVKRSASLTTLQPTVFEPRMAQLETLEAKMASIEVSLSSTPRRKKNGSLSGVSLGGSNRSIPKEIAVKELESLRNALRDKENIIQSLKGQLSIPGLRLTHIRNGNGICANNNTHSGTRELSDVERRQAEERLARLRNDTDAKRLAIKNLKMALERLDITDNIDVRIQQAELEYQLGREELNLLTLLEETRALQHCLEESTKKASDSHTLYSCLSGNDVSLHTTEIVYDPKSPRFGAGQKDTGIGLFVDWALDDTGLFKGDRLLEVNGKIVLTKSREDLARLLQAAPDPAFIVVLRKGPKTEGCQVTSSTNGTREVAALRCELEVVKERAEEAQRAKDGLRTDNIRLTHRISYLEEQVSELLSRKASDGDIRIVNQSPVITSTVKTSQNITNINIRSQPSTVISQMKEPQVFQKGPQMTALVPGHDMSKEAHTQLPVRSKSSLSNVSNTHIPAPSPQPSDYACHKTHRHKHRSGRNGLLLSASTQNLDQGYKKHHHHHHHNNREKDYNSESNSGVDNNYRNRKSLDNSRLSGVYNEGNLMDQSYRKATKIVQDLTKNKETLYEKHRSKCIGASEKYNSDVLRHYNARKSTSVLDFRSEIHIGPKYTSDSRSVEELDVIENKSSGRRLYKKLHDARSVKSLDFDSDCNYPNVAQKNVDYTSEPIDNHKAKPRPTPPKKPLRLSLHRAQSLQSVETPTPNGSPPAQDSRKPMKRNHKGEPPLINGHDKICEEKTQSKSESRCESRSESRTDGQVQSRGESHTQSRNETHPRNDTHAQSRNDPHLQTRSDTHSHSRNDGHPQPRNDAHLHARNENHAQSRNEANVQSRNETHLQPRNDSHPHARHETHAQSRNDAHLQPRNESSRTEGHPQPRNDQHLKSRNDGHLKSRNEAHPQSRNETRNDTHLHPRNESHLQSRTEAQLRNDSHLQPRVDVQLRSDSRNENHHQSRSSSRTDGQFHMRNGEQFHPPGQYQHQQIQSRVEAMNSVNNGTDSRWTTFAQKKDNLVYINDRRGWC